MSALLIINHLLQIRVCLLLNIVYCILHNCDRFVIVSTILFMPLLWYIIKLLDDDLHHKVFIHS